MGDRTCLGVITARGGSKGVRDKNIRLLHGRPVIDYTIQVALACPHINRLILTTDSAEIQAVALSSGAEAPFLRPAELSTDTAKQEDAILHTMEWVEKQGGKFDYLCLLEPTTPLRQVGTLNRGFELLASRGEADAVFSIAECDFSPVFCSTLRADGLMKDWMDEKYKWLNRQEIPAYYQLTPLVTISKWQVFKEKQTFLHETTAALVVDGVEGRDIDSPLEFFLIERLLEKGFHHSSQLSDYVNRVRTVTGSHPF